MFGVNEMLRIVEQQSENMRLKHEVQMLNSKLQSAESKAAYYEQLYIREKNRNKPNYNHC